MMKRCLILLLALLCVSTSLNAQSQSERNALRAQRGVTSYSNEFTSKEQWSVGASVSYSTHVNEDYSLVLVDDIISTGYSFDVSTMFTYNFATNNSVGGRVIYTRDLLRVDSAQVSVGDEESGGVNLSLDDCFLLSHGCTVMAIMRQYIPLGHSKRFALFNEVQFKAGGSQAKYTYDSPVQGTYSTSSEFGISFAPGVTAFVSNNFAIEISVAAMGLSYSKTTQLHNQIYEGESQSSIFSFKVNILSMGFGVTYYL